MLVTRRERERENVASCEINKRQLRVIARVSGRTRVMHGRDGEILTACIKEKRKWGWGLGSFYTRLLAANWKVFLLI